jgi:hypothetical protein
MRQVANAAVIRRFMEEIGRLVKPPVRIYLTGGAQGWRDSTIGVDIKPVPDEPVLRVIPGLKESLQMNIELASPGEFIPVRPGWEERSPLIERYGNASFHHFEFAGQALSKIERGHHQDLIDVAEMLARHLVTPGLLRSYYEAVEPELYRFPAVDPPSFRTALEQALEGEPAP